MPPWHATVQWHMSPHMSTQWSMSCGAMDSTHSDTVDLCDHWCYTILRKAATLRSGGQCAPHATPLPAPANVEPQPGPSPINAYQSTS